MTELREIIRLQIHATADEIRWLKRWLRTPPDRRPARPTTTFALPALKRRATLLCMMIAHSRRRIHLRSQSLDDQGGELRQALDTMESMTYQVPLLDPRLRAAGRAILAQQPKSADPPNGCVAPTVEHRA